MISKGRDKGFFKRKPPIGDLNGNAKISTEIAKTIKKELTLGTKNSEIAARYSVSKHIISKIKTGKTWRHLWASVL